jgi:hypothetical protein
VLLLIVVALMVTWSMSRDLVRPMAYEAIAAI